MRPLVYICPTDGRIARYEGRGTHGGPRRTHAGYYAAEDATRLDWRDAVSEMRWSPPKALQED